MKKIALAVALALAGSSLAIVLATDADADAGGGKICKQALKTHPMAGKHRDLVKQCRAEYKAYKKARAEPYSKRVDDYGSDWDYESDCWHSGATKLGCRYGDF